MSRVRYRGRLVDPIALWSNYIEFPSSFQGHEDDEFSPLVVCPNPDHDTTKRHFQLNLRQPLVHCVDSLTQVRTSSGLAFVSDLVGEKVKTLSVDGVFRDALWNEYGSQQLYEIRLENGDTLFSTSLHEWVVSPTQKSRWVGVRGPQPKRREKVSTVDLVGRRIQLQSQILFRYRSDKKYQAGVRHGLIYGDGTYSQGRAVMRQYGESRALVREFFTGFGSISDCEIWGSISNKWLDCTMVDCGCVDGMKSLPRTDDQDYLRGFIAGLLAADGHVTSRGHVMIHQSNLDELVGIRQLCSKAGISTVSVRMARERNPWTNEISPSWKLTLMKSALWNNGEVDFKLVIHPAHRRNLVQAEPVKQISSVGVLDVVLTGEKDQVYCCLEPVTHTWVTDTGYLSGNCFAGCGISGTYENAIASIEGVTQREARKTILRHSRVGAAPIKKRNTTRTVPDLDNSYERFIPGAPMDYLTGRGFTASTISQWELGWDAEALRVVIPAHDPHGRLRFLIKRTIRPKVEPRYLYPASPVVHRMLFGACKIDLGVIRSQGIVLVEGSLDCMMLHQHGMTNVVAILGSKLSRIQSNLISNMRPSRVFTMFDADGAGISATESVINRLHSESIKVCRYPVGKSDPAQLTKEEALRSIDRAITVSKFNRIVRELNPKPKKELKYVG